MPLPLPFNPDQDLPTLKQRLDWADAGLLEGVKSLEKPHVRVQGVFAEAGRL